MLENWLNVNKLKFSYKESFSNVIINIEDVGNFCLVETEPLFDEKFRLIVSEDIQTDFWLFKFGSQYYFTKRGTEQNPQLNLFKYLGSCKQELEMDFPYLGLHAGYELLNGSRLYKDWIKKAKFYGYTTLGICERNTLGGTLPFQLDCKKNKIKPIIGEEITIKRNNIRFDAKVYVVNDEGWDNLLTIHKAIKIDNEDFVDEEFLLQHANGLIFIFNPDCLITPKIVEAYRNVFYAIFYQIDSVEWNDQDHDLVYLKVIRDYLSNLYEEIPPILINDSYYLDKEDAHIKVLLNNMLGKTLQHKSEDQYFKNLDDNYLSFSGLFEEQDLLQQLIFDCLDNLEFVKNECNFEIDTKHLFLPKFQQDGVENNEDFFWELINKGITDKLVPINQDDFKVYEERIDHEVAVIKKGGFIDYFLILWDIVNWCRENGILVGIGRGSAAGSLVSYLLNITQLDPLQYNLLFERFLNEGRLQGSMPDVDLDIQSNRKDELKEYIKSKYGELQFCSVGTYTTMQIKAAIQDLGRVVGIDATTRNFITTRIDVSPDGDSEWKNIFDNAILKKQIKDFVIKNTELIEDIQLCLGQPKNVSVHASANVIFPREKDIFHWVPVRKEEGLLISEWEGEYLEKAGFLKEDLLGLSQLDKFDFIVKLIKKHYNQDIDIYNVPLDDEKVYDLFCEGHTGDSFHFGSPGLTGYSKLVKPRNIEDLIAMIALFRPGVMETGAHINYISLREGTKDPEYDYMCEEITRDTLGIYIFQEQIMQVCQRLAGFTPVESDDVRKGMGKKIQSLLDEAKPKFIKGAMSNGCPEDEALQIWKKLETFGSYGFNKSHAASYAITGYTSMWLKANYPLEFWAAALEFVKKDEKVPRFICEMNKTGLTSIVPPDVNHSDRKFVVDSKENKIYWSLLQIKEVGEIATEVIIQAREEKGEFYSMEEFIKRVPKKKANKKVIEALIFAGGFDEIEGIKVPHQRQRLFEKYYELAKIKIKDDEKNILLSEDIKKKYFWILKQKEVSGLGYLDYHTIIKEYSKLSSKIDQYTDILEFFEEVEGIRSERLIAGIIVEFKEKQSKKGMFGEILLDVNDEQIYCVLWSELWGKYNELIKNSIGKIAVITGKIIYDSWKRINVMQTEDYTEIDILE